MCYQISVFENHQNVLKKAIIDNYAQNCKVKLIYVFNNCKTDLLNNLRMLLGCKIELSNNNNNCKADLSNSYVAISTRDSIANESRKIIVVEKLKVYCSWL